MLRHKWVGEGGTPKTCDGKMSAGRVRLYIFSYRRRRSTSPQQRLTSAVLTRIMSHRSFLIVPLSVLFPPQLQSRVLRDFESSSGHFLTVENETTMSGAAGKTRTARKHVACPYERSGFSWFVSFPLTSYRTSAPARRRPAAPTGSSRCCRSTRTASLPVNTHRHTWYTPLYLCLEKTANENFETTRADQRVHDNKRSPAQVAQARWQGSQVRLWPL